MLANPPTHHWIPQSSRRPHPTPTKDSFYPPPPILGGRSRRFMTPPNPRHPPPHQVDPQIPPQSPAPKKPPLPHSGHSFDPDLNRRRRHQPLCPPPLGL